MDPVTFAWKDAHRCYWTAVASLADTNDDPEIAVWWVAVTHEGKNCFRFRVETFADMQPDKRAVALGLMAYFNGVALSVMTG